MHQADVREATGPCSHQLLHPQGTGSEPMPMQSEHDSRILATPMVALDVGDHEWSGLERR